MTLRLVAVVRFAAVLCLALSACSSNREEPFFTPPPPPSVATPDAGAASAEVPSGGQRPGTAGVAAAQPPVAIPNPSPSAPSPNAPSPGGQPSEIAASHILVMYRGSMRAPPNVTRTQPEARARAEMVLQRARAGGDFAALAREFSDEPGAAERAGALGRFARGVMAPPFEQAAFALQVGQMSGIVETPFGYHIIRRSQ